MTPLPLWWGAAALGTSLSLVWVVRFYSLRRGVLDVPNHRSAHVVPTPRGGGIGIVLPVVFALLLATPEGWTRAHAAAAAAAVIATGAVGWIDDLRSLSAGRRFLVHLASGALIAAMAMDLGIELAPMELFPGLTLVFWLLWTVSAVNVVNFMDGIDALVALQGVVFSAFAILVLRGSEGGLVLPVVLLGSTLGFLAFNWPPAKIFLGDVGSGSLGVIYVTVGLVIMRETGMTVVHAYLPLLPLFLDELLTMTRRLSRRESLVVAHSSHVYQRLVQSGWSHSRVSLLYAALALVPAAVAAASPGPTVSFLLLAMTVLLLEGFLLLWLRRRAEATRPPHRSPGR